MKIHLNLCLTVTVLSGRFIVEFQEVVNQLFPTTTSHSIKFQNYGTYLSKLDNIYDSFLGVDAKTLARDGSLTETDSGIN